MNKNVVFYNIFIFLFILFLFLQFIYPYFFYTPKLLYKYHNDRTVSFKPNERLWSHKKEFKVNFKTNAYGFNDYDFKKNNDILILGDSFVQAVEVNRTDHFAEYIKEKLNVNVAKIGMAGYGNSHYLSNYLKFSKILNPKVVIVINAYNDIDDNFCNSNTFNCSSLLEICNIDSQQEFNNQIKFLKINKDGKIRFSFEENKNNKNELIIFLKDFIDEFQFYYSLRHIYSMYIQKIKAKENNQNIEKFNDRNNDCDSASDNYYAREYFNKINDLIYNTVVNLDKRKILFINLNANLDRDIEKKELKFIEKSFSNNSYPHINLSKTFDKINKIENKTNFHEDKHLNQFGHTELGKIIVEFLETNQFL